MSSVIRMALTKQCTLCCEILPLSAFYLSGSSGRQSWCIECKRLYNVWHHMLERTGYKASKDPTVIKRMLHYTERGIVVCDRWLDCDGRADSGFYRFRDDVGLHPGPGWCCDRIDCFGPYDLPNVRWIRKEYSVMNRVCKKRGELPFGVQLRANGKFQAKINAFGTSLGLGTYIPIPEAAYAYNVAAKAIWRDFAVLNPDVDGTPQATAYVLSRPRLKELVAKAMEFEAMGIVLPCVPLPIAQRRGAA